MHTQIDRLPFPAGAFAAHAEQLLRNGYSPIPIVPRTKKPSLDAWSQHCLEPLEMAHIRWLIRHQQRAGLGIALGWNGAVAVDVDTEVPEISDAIFRVLPPSPVAKIGQKGSTRFYREPAGAGIASRKLIGAAGRPLVEVLACGCQTILPPSPHPDFDGNYRWLTTNTLLDTPAGDLPEIPADIVEQLEQALRSWLRVRAIGGRAADFRPRSDARPLAGPELKRYRAYAMAALKKKAAALAEQPTGGRNRALFEMVAGLGRHVHHGVIPLELIESAARAACDANGWLGEEGEPAFRAVVVNGLAISKGDALPALPDRPRADGRVRS